MFDASVVCRVRFAPSPVASCNALHELKELISSRAAIATGEVVQAQRQSLSHTGVLMRCRAKSRGASQLPLFHPPIATPRWESLPPEVRQQILALLVRWLRVHAAGDALQINEEVRDE